MLFYLFTISGIRLGSLKSKLFESCKPPHMDGNMLQLTIFLTLLTFRFILHSFPVLGPWVNLKEFGSEDGTFILEMWYAQRSLHLFCTWASNWLGNILPFQNPHIPLCGSGGLVAKSCPTLATPWTARQAPLSMGFSRQEYCSMLPFPSPGDLPNPGIEPGSPALQADSLPAEPRGNHKILQGAGGEIE